MDRLKTVEIYFSLSSFFGACISNRCDTVRCPGLSKAGRVEEYMNTCESSDNYDSVLWNDSLPF